MTKEQLSQYIDLQCERLENEERIDKLERQIEGLNADIAKIVEEGEVLDSVTGGDGGIQRFKIHGFPYPEYNRKLNRLQDKRAEMIRLERELEERNAKIKPMAEEIHRFIYSSDSHIFRILRRRYEDGKSWQQIAMEVGGGNTADTVRKQVERFLKN